MKKCTTCGLVLSLGEFYKRPDRPCGVISSCKKCASKKYKNYRQRTLEELRSYDRDRNRLPHRKKALKENENRYYEKHKISVKQRIGREPEKHLAVVAVRDALRDGYLVKKPCERCGTTKAIHAHHEDYSRPLDVVWLCRTHHGERHREINAEWRGIDPRAKWAWACRRSEFVKFFNDLAKQLVDGGLRDLPGCTTKPEQKAV